MNHIRRFFVLFLMFSLVSPEIEAQDVIFSEGLAVRVIGSGGRSPVYKDLLEYQIISNKINQPFEGMIMGYDSKGEKHKWEKIQAGDDGFFQSRELRGGYLYLNYQSKRSKILILEAQGYSQLYFNGEPRGGDVYNYGWVQHPVEIKRGDNHIYLKVSRGRVKIKLSEPSNQVFLSDRDLTLPDLMIGEEDVKWGAVRLINASSMSLDNYSIACITADGEVKTNGWKVNAMGSRKIGFKIPATKKNAPGEIDAQLVFEFTTKSGEKLIDYMNIKLGVKGPKDHHKRTFISSMDGSVQYYSEVLASKQSESRPALFLSLHGASVEAVNQAAAYQAKEWGHIVAATNRRPYGFDWEDWGRMDAMEVLAVAKERLDPDPRKIYLTGHSMGGHGTWQVGVNYPDHWAAIAPSAGWYSFWSYGGKTDFEEAKGIQEIINRASNPSNTLALSDNYKQYGIYILHGDKDDNVPVSQARFMKKHLAEYHSDFSYYEKPGAGHWWGNQCLDWPPIFDFFKWHQIPDRKEIQKLEFVTANPGINSSSHFIEIYQQDTVLAFSRFKLAQNFEKKNVQLETKNVKLMRVDLSHFNAQDTLSFEIDKQMQESLVVENKAEIWLEKTDTLWALSSKPNLKQKGPHRNGGFKDAFRNRVVLVYGTRGNAKANEWSFNKARFDAESFWYRGNASLEMIADKDFVAEDYVDRNVIIYGNKSTNSAYSKLLEDCPVVIDNDKILFGDHELNGDDLGTYFIYPRADSETASVGVVGGTGLLGMKACNSNRYFISGAGFPDFMIFDAEWVKNGIDNLLLSGFFNNFWGLNEASYSWR